jgi:hypothetical protein
MGMKVFGGLLLAAGSLWAQSDLKGRLSFSGLSSEFSLAELREAIHLRTGDIADWNEIGVGVATLRGLFKKPGKNYVAIPEAKVYDAAHAVSFNFDIEK